MATLLIKKSYRHKDLKEIRFHDLWNSNGVFTTMRVIGKPAKILFNEKGKIVQQKNIFHGYQSKVKVTNESKLFKKNKIFKVGRYHSLKLYEPYKSKPIKITMRCATSNIPMAIENKENNVYGFQFHPESFLTENGNFIIKKILSS